MRIQFYTPLGHHESFTLEPFLMPTVPRQGEHIMFEEGGYEYFIVSVCYTPNEEDYDAYVSLR